MASDLRGALMLFAQKVRLSTLSEMRGESTALQAEANVMVLAATEDVVAEVDWMLQQETTGRYMNFIKCEVCSGVTWSVFTYSAREEVRPPFLLRWLLPAVPQRTVATCLTCAAKQEWQAGTFTRAGGFNFQSYVRT